jgi:hypothetical protein
MEFNDSSEHPEFVRHEGSSLSVDVLVYSKRKDEHTIGWYNFDTHNWHFLCREAVGKFEWRYFNKKTDKT